MEQLNNTLNFVSNLMGSKLPLPRKFKEAHAFGLTKAAESFGRPLVTDRLVVIPLNEQEGCKRSLMASKVKSPTGKEIYKVHIKADKIYE